MKPKFFAYQIEMKYFQLVQKHLAVLGIDAAKKPFNRKIIMMFLLFAIESVLNCTLLVQETVSIRDFIDSIYLTTTAMIVAIFFAIAAFEMTKIFKVIDGMEEISNNSE